MDFQEDVINMPRNEIGAGDCPMTDRAMRRHRSQLRPACRRESLFRIESLYSIVVVLLIAFVILLIVVFLHMSLMMDVEKVRIFTVMGSGENTGVVISEKHPGKLYYSYIKGRPGKNVKDHKSMTTFDVYCNNFSSFFSRWLSPKETIYTRGKFEECSPASEEYPEWEEISDYL